MNLLFYGLLLLNLNLTISVGDNAINLLPSFAGMLLLSRGMERLGGKSRFFANSSGVAMMFAFYAAAVWLMDFFGLTSTLPEKVSLGIGLLQTGMMLYLTYIITVGMKELEKAVKADLNADSLKLFWYFSVVLNIGIYIGYWIPAIALMCMVMNFFLSILFVYTFYKGGKSYNNKVYDVNAINVKK